MFILFMFGEVGFKPLGEFAPCEHDAPSTAFTFESDICAKTRDGPFVGAAWMLFAETEVIVEMEVREHVSPRYRKSALIHLRQRHTQTTSEVLLL